MRRNMIFIGQLVNLFRRIIKNTVRGCKLMDYNCQKDFALK